MTPVPPDLNNSPKYVVSSTLERLEFSTSRRKHPDEDGIEMLELDVRSDDSVERCVAEGGCGVTTRWL
jgi:hypothetical protein